MNPKSELAQSIQLLDDEPALSRSVKVQEGSGIFAFDFREDSEKMPLQLPQRAAHGHERLLRVCVCVCATRAVPHGRRAGAPRRCRVARGAGSTTTRLSFLLGLLRLLGAAAEESSGKETEVRTPGKKVLTPAGPAPGDLCHPGPSHGRVWAPAEEDLRPGPTCVRERDVLVRACARCSL